MVKKLPEHIPGVPITVSLLQLPDYLSINGLAPKKYDTNKSILIVEREAHEKEKTLPLPEMPTTLHS